MNEWKELDVGNLPPDILVGDYEFQFQRCDGVWNVSSNWNTPEHQPDQIKKLIEGTKKYRYRRREPKAPSHTEIITKWWENDKGVWAKVGYYYSISKLYSFQGITKDVNWFTNRQSADIPPE